ncbi:MAG: hypothetical protein EOP35_13235, partial [Rubrivivax sp.]
MPFSYADADMATLTLKNKKPAAKSRTAEGEKRAPVRGKGVSKPRPSLAKAQAERAEREERYQQAQQQRNERPGPQRDAPRDARRDERPARPGPRPGGFNQERPPQRSEPFRRDDRPDRPRDERQGRPGPRPGGAGGFNPDAPQQRAQRGEPVRRNEHRDERPMDRPRDDRPPRVDQRRVANRGPNFEPPQRPQQRHNPAREVAPEDGERLSKRMGELKLASRREADDWIAAGWVRVNGKVAVLGQRVLGDVQIDIDPAARQAQAQLVTVLLHHGLELDGELLKPAKVSWQNEHQLRFVLREGKKRQIRRMCELVGLKVVGLKR